jgi:hypothetical protein
VELGFAELDRSWIARIFGGSAPSSVVLGGVEHESEVLTPDRRMNAARCAKCQTIILTQEPWLI